LNAEEEAVSTIGTQFAGLRAKLDRVRSGLPSRMKLNAAQFEAAAEVQEGSSAQAVEVRLK